MEFDGWLVDGQAYQPGERCTLTGDAAATAQWKPLDTGGHPYAIRDITKIAGGVKVQIANRSGDGAALMLALYSSDGQFLRMASKACQIAKGTSVTVTLALDTADAGTAKAFLLGTDDRTPLSKHYAAKVEP